MTSSEVAKKPSQEVSQNSSGDVVESYEKSSEASASAGLNLNVLGALSGAFSSKSTKETAPDGSSVENTEEEARAKGAGAGNLKAAGAANAADHEKSYRE